MTARPTNKSVKKKGHLGGLTPAENISTMGIVRKERLPLTYGTEVGISVVFFLGGSSAGLAGGG